MAGFFNNFISKITPEFVKKSIFLSNPENMPSYAAAMGIPTLSGVNINHYNAETITAFYNCLRVRAETKASINTYVVEFVDGVKSRASSHPVDYLLNGKANSETNAYSFWYAESLLEDVWGDCYVLIDRGDNGKPRALNLLMPWNVEVIRSKDDGSIWYVHNDKAHPSRNILHFKQNSRDGIKGRSIININREKLGLAKKEENYASATIGEKPPAYFTTDGTITEEQAIKIAQNFKRQKDQGLLPMVTNGLKLENILMPAGDVQLFQMMNITKQDIYSMFRMPSHKAGDYSREAGGTYNNVEQQNINFVQDVVIPMTTQIENECNVKLFSRANWGRFKVEFDLSDLLRADMKTQIESMNSAIARGYMTRNEARAKLGLNPIDPEKDPHGDRYIIQAGFVWADRLDDFIDSKDKNEGQKINGFEKHIN